MDRQEASQRAAQHALLDALRQFCAEPLVQLAEIARSWSAGPKFDARLAAWAAKWHLEELRDVAELRVYYWAGTPAAADQLILLTPPPILPLVLLGHRPSTVIDVEWSPPVVWRPLDQLDPCHPLDPPLAQTDHESRDAYLARARVHYDKRAASLGHTPTHRRRTLARHADWYVRLHVEGSTADQIAEAATTAANTRT